MKREIKNKNGITDGKWIEYNQNGEIESIKNYNKGVLCETENI